MFTFFLQIILFFIGCFIIVFSVCIFIAVMNERRGFKRMAKIHEQNQKEINDAINRVVFDCEAE